MLSIAILGLMISACAGPLLKVTPPPGHLPQPAGTPFSHAELEAIYARIVDPVTGNVDYERLRDEYIEDLDDYLTDAAEARPDRWPVGDQKAFWINVHNAAAIRQVAHHWPISDLLKIGELLHGPLDTRFIVAGDDVSLADMHDILEDDYNDPLLKYGLNWGCRGCPALNYRPYTAVGLELQLTAQKDKWLKNNPPFDLDNLDENFDWTVNAAR